MLDWSASVAVTLFISALLVFAVELVARGSFADTLLFFGQPFRPSWTTVLLFSLVIVFIDAVVGRAYYALFIVAPIALALAFVGHEKAYYLGDPLYPADFLYVRQIAELLPLLARQRPGTAMLAAAAIAATAALLFATWRYWRPRSRKLSMRGRLGRLALALPALAFFISIMDYATFSWTRDRLQIIPMMWDQRENYNSNGFAIAFALNVPMAKVSAPEGYSQKAVETLAARPEPAITVPLDRPDVIMVMSESFWDPTLLPGVTITPDPIPTVRALRSGHMFSPEFGGMTANIEFEALTGFSNAFLPYGSIPYQQYVRAPMPSLAKFFKSQGYTTRAIHPFAGWFWNRTPVYGAFGFDRFMNDESLPYMSKRGPLPSDAALTDEIVREADGINGPFFLFTVTLQNHGPYEPFRYGRTTLALDTAIESRESLRTYAEGAADADRSLRRLIDWASTRSRRTIIVFFGDHLPPLGPVYTETGFMKDQVADRRAPLPEMRVEHDTPLVIWSNRTGTIQNIGDISPAFIPMHILRTAGFTHPYYTGILGRIHDEYRVIDRNMLVTADGEAVKDWARQKDVDAAIKDLRLLQYDVLFGSRFSEKMLFPEADRIEHPPAS